MRNSPNSALILVAAWLTVCCGVTASFGADTTRYRLPNGLNVILRPLSGAPHTAVVTLFSIGGDHDPQGASGLAHLVEHVYVTAAAGKTAARSAEQLMRAYPAGWNAQTGDDYTVFSGVVPAGDLPQEIQRHAERMGDLQIGDPDLRREMPRIEQELANMFGGIPMLGALNLAREKVRPTPHNGRKGGRIAQLQQVSVDDLHTRWQKFYKPKNALLIVAGDFDAADVKSAVDSAFGNLPAGEAAPAAPAPHPAKPAKAESIVAAAIRPGLPSTAVLAFAVPAAASRDYAPFLLLYHRMLRQSTGTFFNLPSPEPMFMYNVLDDPSVAPIVVKLRADESLEQVEARLRAFVERAASAPWRDDERLVARQNMAFFLGTAPMPDAVIANNVYGVAFSLGRRHQLGLDGDALAKELDRVTGADVARVAKKYFAPDRGAVVAVRPKKP